MGSLLLTLLTLAILAPTGRIQSLPSDARIREEAAKWFSGPLSHVPDETRLNLVRLAHRTPGGVRALTSETFRGNLYLEVLLNSSREEEHPGRPGPVVDRLKAVRSLADSRLIPALAQYAAGLGEVRGVHGIKLLLIELPANSFIQLYSPLSAINSFRAGTLNAQGLLNASVIYINNDLVEIR